MQNNNCLKTKKITYYDVDFSCFNEGMVAGKDDNLMNLKQAKYCYNYIIKDGSLKNGIGFEELTLPTPFFTTERKIKVCDNPPDLYKIWYYQCFSRNLNKYDNVFFVYGSDKKIYHALIYTGDSYMFWLDDSLLFEETPVCINYNLDVIGDAMIMCSPSDSVVCFAQNNYYFSTISTAPKFVSICVCEKRLFAVESGRQDIVRYSSDTDPTNWTTAVSGYLQFQDSLGKVNKLVNFGKYIYAFRDYGITRITAYGEESSFSSVNLYETTSKIFAGSVVCCEDRIMFLSTGGLYSFNGSASQRVKTDLDAYFGKMDNSKCTAVLYKGKYYLSLKIDFGDDKQIGCESGEYVNNALIVLDIKTDEINITRGVDIICMCPIQNENICKLACLFGSVYKTKIAQITSDGKIFGSALTSYWQSPYTNLGYNSKKKIIKEISLETNSAIVIEVKTENGTTEYSVAGKTGAQTIRPNIVCEKVSIAFKSESSSCNVSRPRLKFGVIE